MKPNKAWAVINKFGYVCEFGHLRKNAVKQVENIFGVPWAKARKRYDLTCEKVVILKAADYEAMQQRVNELEIDRNKYRKYFNKRLTASDMPFKKKGD